MAKPIIKFKTYRQSAQVGGKIYGVPNLGDPVVANVTMAEVIDYAKLHNYSADTLEALLSQVISGVADLVARDGRPRNLSDLLKFEPVIKGTFANMEQTVTTQKVLVRPRLLKEIRVKLNADDYAWQNQNDKESPRIISIAPVSDDYDVLDYESFVAGYGMATGSNGFGWNIAGSRLCPSGWDPATCQIDVLYRPVDGSAPIHLIRRAGEPDEAWGHLVVSGNDASDNLIPLAFNASADAAASSVLAGWTEDELGSAQGVASFEIEVGGVVEFRFTRTTGSGDTFEVVKTVSLKG